MNLCIYGILHIFISTRLYEKVLFLVSTICELLHFRTIKGLTACTTVSLTYFISLVSFYSPKKHHKTIGVQIFSEALGRDKWHEHCVKSVQIWSFCGPYFPVFGLNAEIYSVNLHIQSKYRKIRARKNSVFGYFSRS